MVTRHCYHRRMSPQVARTRVPYFRTEKKMPESLLHVQLRTALWQLLDEHFGDRGLAGTDQFVYWDRHDAKQNLAPDVYFGLGSQPLPLKSWKTWERGVPDLAIEFVSDSDSAERAKEKSVGRYTELGVRELIRFDRCDGRTLLEAWDIERGLAIPRRIDDRLVTPCKTLGCTLVVAPIDGIGRAVRLARDPAGRELFPTQRETTDLVRKEAAREREQAARERERAASLAEARIAELMAELAAAKRDR